MHAIDEKYAMGLQRPRPLQKGSGVQTLFDLGGGVCKKGSGRVGLERVWLCQALGFLKMLQRALEFLIFTSVEHTRPLTGFKSHVSRPHLVA